MLNHLNPCLFYFQHFLNISKMLFNGLDARLWSSELGLDIPLTHIKRRFCALEHRPIEFDKKNVYFFIAKQFMKILFNKISVFNSSMAVSLNSIAWSQGYTTFLCSTQLSTKFILLINVKMPTVVGILTFISMISIISERLKQDTYSVFCILVFMSS